MHLRTFIVESITLFSSSTANISSVDLSLHVDLYSTMSKGRLFQDAAMACPNENDTEKRSMTLAQNTPQGQALPRCSDSLFCAEGGNRAV
eukprot:scaffold152072_cov17-Tisochrysis_lutea.AAC.2